MEARLYYLRDKTMMVAARYSLPLVSTSGGKESSSRLRPTAAATSKVDPKSGRFLVVDKTLESAPRFVKVATNFFELLELESLP